MAIKPTINKPEFATAATGSDISEPTARKTTGFVAPGGLPEKPNRQELNFLFKSISAWTAYFEQLTDYTPDDISHWSGSADPGNVSDALDQAVSRLFSLENYTPGTTADWINGTDPGTTSQAIDQLASRINTAENYLLPTGLILPNPTNIIVPGFMKTNGQNFVRSDFKALFFFLGCTYGFGNGSLRTLTSFSITTDIVTATFNAHGLSNGDLVAVKFAISGEYYNRGVEIFNVTANTFDFSIADWNGIQPTGTVEFIDGTTAPVPFYNGTFLRGWDNGSGIDPDAGSRTNRGDGVTGDQIGTKQSYMLQSHAHHVTKHSGSSIYNRIYVTNHYGPSGQTDDPTHSSGGNETRPRNTNVMWMIKT